MPHPTREACRLARREGLDMDGHARRLDSTSDIGIGAKEIVENTTHLRTCLHPQDRLEGGRVDLDVARMLRVEKRAVERRRLVVAAVVMLQLGLNLALLEVLLEEARELGNLGIVGELRHIDARKIEFVTQEDCLLLVDTRLADYCTNKQVLAADRGVAAIVALPGLLLCARLTA